MTERNYDIPARQTDDTDSEYIGIDGSSAQLDLGELFSHEFTNIMPYYTSPNGPIEIYTANRYGKRYVLKGLNKHCKARICSLAHMPRRGIAGSNSRFAIRFSRILYTDF